MKPIKSKFKQYIYRVNGTKGNRKTPVSAECRERCMDDAKVLFAHSPQLLGVTIDWRTLRLDYRSVKHDRTTSLSITVEACVVSPKSDLPRRKA